MCVCVCMWGGGGGRREGIILSIVSTSESLRIMRE